MSQPPYGPPPQGWPPAESDPHQPWGQPQQGQPAPWGNGQPPYPPQTPQAYPPPGQPPYGFPATRPQPPLYKRPWFVVVAGLVAIGVIGSAVSGNDDEGSSPAAASSSAETSAPSSFFPAPTTTQAPAPPPAAVAPTPEAVPPAPSFTMPDVVGMDLQSAQNLIQTYGPFVSRSHDLLGSRAQLIDSGWIVCDQNIAPGQQVAGDAEGQVDLGVVKREESCP